jgi:hypothetical protein
MRPHWKTNYSACRRRTLPDQGATTQGLASGDAALVRSSKWHLVASSLALDSFVGLCTGDSACWPPAVREQSRLPETSRPNVLHLQPSLPVCFSRGLVGTRVAVASGQVSLPGDLHGGMM